MQDVCKHAIWLRFPRIWLLLIAWLQKKKVKKLFPEASTNHRDKNTGVNRNLQMGGESRWKPPSFSAMNGPDVNLVGCLVFCGAALWGRPTRASSQTFQEHIQRNTPEV